MQQTAYYFFTYFCAIKQIDIYRMKNRIILAITLIGLTAFANAQNSFPTNNAIWNYKVRAENWLSGVNGSANVYYSICGDTIFNNTTYNKLYTTLDTTICGENSGQFLGGLRQDEQKVYFYCAQFREFLLYDFGLSIGDTMDIDYGFYYSFWSNNNKHEFMEQYQRLVVNNIQIVNGIKIFSLSQDFGQDIIWYEGIGSINGLFHKGIPTLDGYSFDFTLNCFKHNDIVEYLSNPDCNKCFCRNYVGIKENTMNNVNIFPNPTKDILNIDIPENINIKSITIYSIDGKLIAKKKYSFNSGQLNISSLAKGSYTLDIETDKGNFSKTIIRE